MISSTTTTTNITTTNKKIKINYLKLNFDLIDNSLTANSDNLILKNCTRSLSSLPFKKAVIPPPTTSLTHSLLVQICKMINTHLLFSWWCIKKDIVLFYYFGWWLRCYSASHNSFRSSSFFLNKGKTFPLSYFFMVEMIDWWLFKVLEWLWLRKMANKYFCFCYFQLLVYLLLNFYLNWLLLNRLLSLITGLHHW